MPEIPKRAFFYWSGPEMPWIRKQSLASFRRINPSWKVDLFLYTNPIDAVKRSDLFRYQELAKHGGWYFDTDIIFTRPMDALLEQIGEADTVVCYDYLGPMTYILPDGSKEVRDQHEFYSVASLACAPSNAFYRATHEAALFLSEAEDMQSCGVHTFNSKWQSLDNCRVQFPGLHFHSLPVEAFLPVRPNNCRTLYRDDGPDFSNDPGVFGVHWYGGDATARISAQWDATNYWRDCPLGRLLSEQSDQRLVGAAHGRNAARC